MMQGAGVGLLAGTDLPPNAADGTIHDELAALVQAGLTPIEAFRTATVNQPDSWANPASQARFKKEKNAHLVLLEVNPLEDIRNTSKVSAVILNGQMVKP